MPKFNIGDKVKIRDNLVIDEMYGDLALLSGMVFEKEKTVTYVEYRKHNSRYKLDGMPYLYNESMLELVKEDNTMTMPKLETGMIVIDKHDSVGVVAGNVIWYNDGGVDDVKEVLMYLERNKFDGYIKYIIKNRSGFYYIQHNLPNIKADKPVTGIEVLWKYEEPIPEVTLDQIYEKFGHKVKIIPNPLDKSE